MDADDLMIGSWFHEPVHNKANFRVEMFLGQSCVKPKTIAEDDDNLTFVIETLKPVPWSDYWRSAFDIGRYTEIDGNQIEVHNGWIYMDGPDSFTGGMTATVKIEHVHQLQLIWKALTGKSI